MLIIHGHISDLESTTEAIVQASEIPLSIIMVAVSEGIEGPGLFKNLEMLDADKENLVDVNN